MQRRQAAGVSTDGHLRRNPARVTEAEAPMIKVAEPSGGPGSPPVPTKRQRSILQFIEEYAAAKRCAPSDQEIAVGVGLKSRSSVQYHLVLLKAAGYVNYQEGVPRTVRVLPRDDRGAPAAGENGAAPGRARPRAKRKTGPAAAEKVVWVPVVGQVAAGEPIPPLESIQDRFPLPREMVGAEEGLFILTVVGDSMIGAGIHSGDMVVVRQLYERPQNGDIVAALFDGFEDEGTVKTYKKVDRHIWLMSQNPAYTPILGDKATIHGKVVAVLRQV
jgi:repressor LexA